MSKDLSRVSYTRRIMEIVHNIQRQKEDINKILGDTRLVQKEINQLTGKLDRVFTVTDEQIFRDARKDEARRKAYKLLANLREVVCRFSRVTTFYQMDFCVCVCQNCDLVVEAIKDTGDIKRKQRDLEEQVSLVM